MVRDFWSKGLVSRDLRSSSRCSRVLRRPPQSPAVLETCWNRSVTRMFQRRLPLLQDPNDSQLPVPPGDGEGLPRSTRRPAVGGLLSSMTANPSTRRCTRPASGVTRLPGIVTSSSPVTRADSERRMVYRAKHVRNLGQAKRRDSSTAQSTTRSHTRVSIDTIVQWTDHRPSVQFESGGDGHGCARHRTKNSASVRSP
jgi:hypothetical protein